MTQADTTIAPKPTKTDNQPSWLIVIVVWQVILAIGAIALAIGMITGAVFDLRGVGLVIAAALAGVVAFYALYSIPRLLAHRNAGRTISTLLNYTLLVVLAVAALQVMEIFRGIDAVATNFREQWQWSLIIILGWLILRCDGLI